MLQKQIPEISAELYRMAVAVDSIDFREYALELLNDYVQFDSALWGNFAWVNQRMEERDFYTLNIPREFFHNHGELAEHDPLTNTCFQNPGITITVAADKVPPEAKRLRENLKELNFGYGMATCVILQNSGLVHAINLIRKRQNSPFTQDECMFKQALMPHLVESLRRNLHLQIRRELLRKWEEKHCTATSDLMGVLSEAEDRFIDMLLEEWPNWQGAKLPQPLIDKLSDNTDWKFLGEHIVVQGGLVNNNYLMIASKPGPLSKLSRREEEIARLFSNGKSNKTIANSLNISPVTTRNHVASIYRKLNIHNKTELLNILNQADGLS